MRVFALVLNLFYGFLLNSLVGREGSLVPWKLDHVLIHLDISLGIQAASIARIFQGTCRLIAVLVHDLSCRVLSALGCCGRQGNFNCISGFRARSVDGPCGQFKYRMRTKARGNAPRADAALYFSDSIFAVQVDEVDGEAHEECVH
jgi:hypothetical protein